MEESFLPWWLILLLVMCAVALTLWQSAFIHRELRLWSGLATLVYLGLIFLVLRSNSVASSSLSAASSPGGIAYLGSIIGMAISLTASLWLLGRGSLHSRHLSYLLLTIVNAVACVLWNEPEVAMTL